jgi:hypothetical protein
VHLKTAIGGRVLFGQRRSDPRDIRARLLARDRFAQPALELENPQVAPLERARLIAADERGPHHQRHVDVRPQELVEAREAFGRNADDRELDAVHAHAPPDDGGIGAERTLPKPMAQDRHGVTPRHGILRRSEYAPNRRLHAHRAEEVAGYERRRANLGGRIGARGELDCDVFVRRQAAGEARRRVANVDVVRVRRAQHVRAAGRHVHGADGDDFVRVRDRQRAQQQSVGEAEGRRVRADPDGERQHRDQREAGTAREQARSHAQVLDEDGRQHGRLQAMGVPARRPKNRAPVAALPRPKRPETGPRFPASGFEVRVCRGPAYGSLDCL